NLTGMALLVYALIASVGAPLFEELVFRGFLFNMLRSSLRGKNAMRLLRSGTVADVTAIAASSAVFAVSHQQFHPTTLVLLFTLGCVHAELYRRSGSLPLSMLLHLTNNGLVMLSIAMAR